MSSPDDYDGPWKEALEVYLPDIVAFFFPEAHAAIAWGRGYEWLDKELQLAAPDAERGAQAVDKLVGVWLHDGEPAWLLLHLEVQSQYDRHFSRRMFRYHTRLYGQHEVEIVSLAILGDERPNWRPGSFGYGRWGCEVRCAFPIVKVLEYDLDELAASANPCAIVVLAHRTAQMTRHDPTGRAAAKVRLARLLYQRGYERAEIARLYRLIDWLLRLPEDLDRATWYQIRAIEEEYRMPYITTAERVGRAEGLAEGRAQGLKEGIAVAARIRFGQAGEALAAETAPLADPALLEAIMAKLETAATLDEVRALLPREG